ncbi:small ribosomal subunit Rsm22 family protein [Humidesulfovibrio idahonensis]
MSPEQIFPRPSREFLTLLAGLPKHLDAAMPMRRQHRRELPGDIRHLSHLLTDERGDLRRDYLADPAALSAYMRYFLPWNIYRLGTLFAGLSIDPGGDNPDGAATIVDLGTGPLTAPLTLWMSRPHLRKRPLTFICVDRAPKPMRLGLDALHSLAAAQGGLAPWKVTLVKGPLDARLREKADLLIMANALNEVLHRGEGELLEDADALAWHLSNMLTPTGSLCVVEPGIRPSAHLMSALRRGFLHHGLNPIAPCPHTGPCPMSGRGFTAWCHFNFDAEAAPNWLKALSDEAKLAKDNVSLSFLSFSAKGRKLEPAPGKTFVRAVSGPFELPAPEGQNAARRFGQYACSEHGLTLLSVAQKHLVPLPGALLEATWPAEPVQDAKSGALILPMGTEHTAMRRSEADPADPAPKHTSATAARKDASTRRDAPARHDARDGRNARDFSGKKDGRSAAPRSRRQDESGADAPGRGPERTPRPASDHGSGPAAAKTSPRPPRDSAPRDAAPRNAAKDGPKRTPRQDRNPEQERERSQSQGQPYDRPSERKQSAGAPDKSLPKTLTVDALIAAEESGTIAAPKAERRKRLPSERPADEKRSPRKPGAKKPGAKKPDAKTGGKAHASRAERKAGGKPGAQNSGKPGSKPGNAKKPRSKKES